MQINHVVTELSRNDSKLIGRDSFLLTMIGYSVVLAVILRFLLPWANDYAARNEFPVNVVEYYPMLIAFLVLFLGTLFAGLVFGFLLLEEREDDTIKALLVTPMPPTYYVLYRILAPTVLSFALVFMQFYIVGLALIPLWQLLPILVSAALAAPIMALFFATFAENKVQGFALMKFTGLAGMVFIAAWFVSEPLQYLFGIAPYFWTGKAYWMALDGNPYWWIAVLIGIAAQLATIAALVWRFNRVVYN